MRSRRVVYLPEALEHLRAIRRYIAGESGLAVALSFTESIREFCERLSTFPQRGTRRDHLRPGLRIIGFQRRVAIAFVVPDEDRVVIVGILYGGRDLDGALRSIPD